MTVVAVVALVVAVAAVAVAARQWQSRRAAERFVRDRLAAEQERRADLEAAVAAAEAGRDEQAAAAAGLEQAREELRRLRLLLDGPLWGLELLRNRRTWGVTGWPAGEVASPERWPATAAGQLRLALEREMETVREEVGVRARLGHTELTSVRPFVALATLRLAQELLPLVARRTEDLSLDVDATERGVELTVVGEGWDGTALDPEPVEALRLVAGVLGGSVEVRTGEGAVGVRATVPSL